jgi:predicted metal-binding membrane protein
VIAAVLLAGTGMLFELAAAKLRSRKSRVVALGVIGLGFLFVWAELAVGLVGSPLAGS